MDDLHLWIFLLTLGLVARLTHLVVDDKITAPIRDALSRAWARGASWDETSQTQKLTAKAKLAKFATELTNCAHCTSVWVASAAVPVVFAWGDSKLYLGVAAAATFSYITGFLAQTRYAVETRTENLDVQTQAWRRAHGIEEGS